jgi:hypothetical protein
MKSLKKILLALTELVSGALLAIIITRFKARNSRKRLLKKVDVFAEPFMEKLDEVMDIIIVTFDDVMEVVAAILPHRKPKPALRKTGERTTPGRYVIPKVKPIEEF